MIQGAVWMQLKDTISTHRHDSSLDGMNGLCIISSQLAFNFCRRRIIEMLKTSSNFLNQYPVTYREDDIACLRENRNQDDVPRDFWT